MPDVETDGVRIHFEDIGSGPAVVFGHSFLCSGEMWAPQVSSLAKRYRVINIDQRGHGQSGNLSHPFDLYDMVGDVVAVLDHAGIETAVWAGLSIGGMVAMRAALTVPDRVRALVLADTHAGREKAYKTFKYRAMILGTKAVGIGPFLPTVSSLMFGSSTRQSQPDLVAEWNERFAAVHMPSIGMVLEALVRRDSVLDRLRHIEVPTLVIVGAEDASLPVTCSQEIAAAIPNSCLVVIPGAGHLSCLENPEAVSEALIDFLNTLS
jgi:3-oxoadipate enol-lactonase